MLGNYLQTGLRMWIIGELIGTWDWDEEMMGVDEWCCGDFGVFG